MPILPKISPRQILRHRLAAQYLTASSAGTAADVVRTLGAVQAQDYAGAKWGLGMRVKGATDESIEAIIDRGEILRTHVLRPTWHFVLPEDIRWMQTLTSPRVRSSMTAYHRTLGLDEKTCRRSAEVIRRALEGNKALTRREIGDVLARARIKHNRLQPLAHLVMRAELDAVVCSGPRRGKESTYALVDERAPKVRERDRDESIRDLAIRYFSTRGPASAHDFAWWSGLSAADARRGTELLPKEFATGRFNDTTMWFLERALPRATPMAHVLPNYDEYFIGLRDRSAIGGRVRDVKFAATPDNPFFAHLVFVNGDLVGGWKRIPSRNAITVKLTMVVKLTAAERKLVDKALTRFSVFTGQEVRVL